VLGKAKVINYKDFVEARVKHVEKKFAYETKSKTRRGRKCKSSPPDLPEAEENNANMARYSQKQKNSILEADESTIDIPKYSRKYKSPAQNPPESSNIITRV
jgi:hypothetical protein